MTEKLSRRSFFTKTLAASAAGAAGAAGFVLPNLVSGRETAANLSGVDSFQLPDLPYATNALEPVISAQIMEIHHGKHHAGYVRNLNDALEAVGIPGGDLGVILKNLSNIPTGVLTRVRQNGGGALNHALFWDVMSPQEGGGGGQPNGALARAINTKWGGFEAFKNAFSALAGGVFGSGWAWLSVDAGGRLFISQTANQDNPLMRPYVAESGTPILGLDVWEHAYYLQYENRRGDYIKSWWNVVDWDNVAQRYAVALRGEMIVEPLKS